MQNLKTKVRRAIKGYNPSEMYEHTMREGGSTARKGMLGGMKHQKYRKGYQVALGREFEQTVNPNKQEFIQAYKDTTKKFGKKGDIGTWYDPDTKKISIEPSQVMSNKQKAIEIGKKRKQFAVYGFKEGKSFKTGFKG
jgi:hypothetical protein